MAPRGRGGPSSDSSSSSDGTYYDDSNALFSRSLLNAMYAEIACSSALLLAAVVAAIIVLVRPWLNRDGSRRKGRLFTFLFCLAAILAGRAVQVADIALRLQGPNDIEDSDYYTTYAFVVRSVVASLLDWVATIPFFALVLVEILRRNRLVNHMQTSSEVVNSLLIIVLGVFALVAWIISARVILGYYHGDYYFDIDSNTLIGLGMAYAVLALIFAIIMWASTPGRNTKDVQGSSKFQLRYLSRLGWALFYGQALYLAASCITYFGDFDGEDTVIVSIIASAEVVWMIKIVLMALFAQDSYKAYHRNDTATFGTDNSNVTQSEPVEKTGHAAAALEWQKPGSFAASTTATTQHHPFGTFR